MSKLRLVVDTNILISALLSKGSSPFQNVEIITAVSFVHRFIEI